MARLGSVLFVCTHNAIRSPMAAALLRHRHGRSLFVDSVGLFHGRLDPLAVAAMAEIGIDLADHRSKTFETLEDDNFDLVISLSPEAQHHAVELTRTSACTLEYWPIPDPSRSEASRDARLDLYRQTRDDLSRRITTRFGPPSPPRQPAP